MSQNLPVEIDPKPKVYGEYELDASSSSSSSHTTTPSTALVQDTPREDVDQAKNEETSCSISSLSMDNLEDDCSSLSEASSRNLPFDREASIPIGDNDEANVESLPMDDLPESALGATDDTKDSTTNMETEASGLQATCASADVTAESALGATADATSSTTNMETEDSGLQSASADVGAESALCATADTRVFTSNIEMDDTGMQGACATADIKAKSALGATASIANLEMQDTGLQTACASAEVGAESELGATASTTNIELEDCGLIAAGSSDDASPMDQEADSTGEDKTSPRKLSNTKDAEDYDLQNSPYKTRGKVKFEEKLLKEKQLKDKLLKEKLLKEKQLKEKQERSRREDKSKQ